MWSGKCPFGEMSYWANVQSGKCPSVKCLVGKLSVRRNVSRGSVHRGGVSRGTAQPGNCPHTDRTGFQKRDITKFKDKIGQMRNWTNRAK